MPQYEWVCTHCGNKFALYHRTREPSPPLCLKCKGPTVRRFSVPYIIVR